MASLDTIGGIHYEIMKRCYNPKSVMYKTYGEKGIEVCKEWHDRENFKKWAINNGYKKGLRLERIDSLKDYTPDNCRFGISHRLIEGSSAQITKGNKAHRDKMKKWAGINGHVSKLLIYSKYRGIISRCYRKDHVGYKDYGGRGIKICDEWLGFDGFCRFYKWAIENGYDEKLTIDRIDNNCDYSPSNCRWVTAKIQSINRRNNIKYNYYGSPTPLSVIAEKEEIKYSKLYLLVRKKNVEIEKAIEQCKAV